MRFDLNLTGISCAPEVATEVVAARFFLADGRFTDNRTHSSQWRDAPSAYNCIRASIFLCALLRPLEPSGDWTVYTGSVTSGYEGHAFALGHSNTVLADITTDQFTGLPDAVFGRLSDLSAYHYEVKSPMAPRKPADASAVQVSEWLREWGKLKNSYRANAQDQIGLLSIPATQAAFRR